MTAIVKSRSPVDLHDLNIAAMFAMYLRAPARPTREEVTRGAITDLGEIGSVREKNWSRETAYSPARVKMTVDAVLQKLEQLGLKKTRKNYLASATGLGSGTAASETT